ncbi:MAG TPA: aldo/keto reductase [Tepidisphaeraceae bacterium]|nr:aldo/keto reductase [Tepidisphaeraceae bacterium]
MSSRPKLKWGVLAAGGIARAFAEGLATSQTGTLVAIASRSQAKADAFGQELNIPHRHGSYEALLEDPEVDAVYIATPHPSHAEWAIKAAEAGKHLLVEKPIAMNFREASAVVEAAIEHDVFLMEAFMYRCHPQTRRLVELLRARVIGQVRVIHATFSFDASFDPASRIYSNALGGGGILDVGCYPASMARLISGVATGNDVAEPIELKAVGHLGATGVDEWSAAVLRFPGDIIAQLSSGVAVQQENVVRIDGTAGSILVPLPWAPARDGGTSTILVTRKGQREPSELRIESPQQIYGIEADTVAEHIVHRKAPAMTPEDSLGNMRTLDAWRKQIGLVYEQEQFTANIPTVTRRPLAVRPKHNMKYGQIAGLEKRISRLVIGCDNQQDLSHASIMFDDFYSRGGTAFDTAHIYGGGSYEKLLGRWLSNRGVREDVVIIGKGAHTPNCNPAGLTKQLHESLERMGVAGVDIYLMHRDNPEVAVGEFVDVLNEHVRAGRIKVFGGSNWTTARVDEANAYAAAKGLQGFGVVSNNFSLARMIDPVWPGCVSASDPDSRAWFERTRMPLLAWSSQARGFFLPGRAHPDQRDDAERVRCWYSDDNFQRLARAKELAAKYNVLPINIALAYVLNQPFPTFALIGPRQLSETRTSLPALDVQLSPDELAWLNLEHDQSQGRAR